MKITCNYTYPGQPEMDRANTVWSFIANADKLSCVVDGDAIAVAAIKDRQETPLLEVGLGLWKRRGVLAEAIAGYAPRSGEHYRSRLRVIASKSIDWLGDDPVTT